jgi:tetratricopeptide (TPR) repeat protein
MLNYWLPVLADRGQKGLSAAAVKDVERVRGDDKAGAAAKAQALAVEGLAQRNRGDFAKARETLKDAEDAAGDAAWKGLVTKARKELEAPAAFYLPQAEALRAQRRYEEALAILDEGLKAFPDRSGQLLAVRSLVRLDAAANVRNKLREDSPGIKEARADADAAIKAGSQGAGHFAAGRIAEALGQRDAATASYRQAVKEAPAGSAELSRSSLALARMLVQHAEGRGAMLPGPRGGNAVAGRPLSVREMLLMTMVGLQPPSPEEMSQKEALDLVDKILQRKDIDEQPLLKAQALAIKGQWTEALNTYVEGLRGHLARDQFEGLKYIVTNHPVQRTPDRLRVAQPFQAERHYLAGLSRYHARDFASAEKEFGQAISNFDQDARYHYFLGLSRLQQGKRGSAEEFDEAARLEADGRPARAAVDAALERVQGEPRRSLVGARSGDLASTVMRTGGLTPRR